MNAASSVNSLTSVKAGSFVCTHVEETVKAVKRSFITRSRTFSGALLTFILTRFLTQTPVVLTLHRLI